MPNTVWNHYLKVCGVVVARRRERLVTEREPMQLRGVSEGPLSAPTGESKPSGREALPRHRVGACHSIGVSDELAQFRTEVDIVDIFALLRVLAEAARPS